MYHYLYTNDMRVSSLEEKAIEFAKLFLTDSVPTADENKSVNNNANTIGFYLNLANKGNSALLAAKNDVRGVVLNFIKTFQFPNPRTKDSFEKAVADGIQLAPLREIIKLLFLFGQMQKEEAYLTSDEVLSFIFYNDNLAKNTSPDRVSVIREILEYRKSGLLAAILLVQTSESGIMKVGKSESLLKSLNGLNLLILIRIKYT